MSARRQHVFGIAWAALGLAIAFGGTEVMLVLASIYPDQESAIQAVGPWVIALSVCMCSLYPIFRTYGLVKTSPPDGDRKT